MARFSLVPRNEKFFEDFVTLAEEIRKGSRLLKQMLASDPPDMTRPDQIKDIEHSCDSMTRSIIDRLNRTFVTPLDREDIHAMAISLDDVMDAIDAAGVVTTWDYDALGRPTRTHDPRGTDYDVIPHYDELDRITQTLALDPTRLTPITWQ